MTDAAVTAAEKTLRDFLEPWLDVAVHGTTLESQIRTAARLVVRDVAAVELEGMRPELEAAIARQIEPLFAALGGLLRVVAEECRLTDAVMAAADNVRVAMVALGMRDIGPPPA